MPKALFCRVSGRVQGVFFRVWTKEAAQSLGLTGWVRNSPDGRVEIIAQGADEALNEFRVGLRRGPDFSLVDSVECRAVECEEEFQDFSIRY